MKRLFLVLLTCAAPALAQAETESGTGAEIRILDGLRGTSETISLLVGERHIEGKISIELLECRFPKDAIGTDAFAHLKIQDLREEEPRFSGWMIASSPALSALEHARYDVWVIRCSQS